MSPTPTPEPEKETSVLVIIFKIIAILAIGAVVLTVLVFGSCLLMMRR